MPYKDGYRVPSLRFVSIGVRDSHEWPAQPAESLDSRVVGPTVAANRARSPLS
jgi:hypothetical protein